MNIAIVGLGLIGGSYAKAITEYTDNKVYAISHNSDSIAKAINEDVIVKAINEDELKDMDITIVALPPTKTIEFLENNVDRFSKGSIVSDICGVKCAIQDRIKNIYTKYRVNYISIHPMAGRECSGYNNSLATLFRNRSLIMIKNDDVDISKMERLELLNRKLGFSNVVYTTANEHDRIIAYTSQMCHITSNAFVKSPTSRKHQGFSGGSFEDLTRVAFLDPKIWIELFSMNKDNLLEELSLYIDELKKYQDALSREDYARLYDLLKEGRDIKASI